MSTSFTPGLIRSRNRLVRKVRELPVSGTVLKEIGDKVIASEDVAKAELPGELLILRIAEHLGIEPFEVMNSLKVREGDSLGEGALLCEHSGLFGLMKSRFYAPTSGIIELVSERTGHLGLRLSPKPISINAYIDGTVAEVEKGKSLTIESNATFVQGIFGIGGERCGTIKMLDIAPQSKISEEHIPDDCAGLILVGGCNPSHAALALGAQRGALGLVTGSVDDQALAKYLGYDLGIALTGDEAVPMSVIITEGFGHIAISNSALELLRENDGNGCSINGATQVRAGALRPEIIICNQRQATQDMRVPSNGHTEAGLAIGKEIRIIRVPYFGKIGKVVELPENLEKIETGAEARVLRARIRDNSGHEQLVTLPRANVELI